MSHADAIEHHYTRLWAAPKRRIRLGRGRIAQLSTDFSVLVFSRSAEVTAYATRAMSQSVDEEGLELHMLVATGDAQDDGVAEVLTAVAHYHRTGAHLDLGHTVNFGRPWLPGSGCTHGLISLPYLQGPDLEWLDSPRVRFLWLIPVTLAEVEFKKVHGLERLEEEFEKQSFNYLDPHRPSVV
jgi:hypothetical protein